MSLFFFDIYLTSVYLPLIGLLKISTTYSVKRLCLSTLDGLLKLFTQPISENPSQSSTQLTN